MIIFTFVKILFLIYLLTYYSSYHILRNLQIWKSDGLSGFYQMF